MGVEEHRATAAAGAARPGWAVVTVSDTRTAETDLSGAALVDRLRRAGFEVVRKALRNGPTPKQYTGEAATFSTRVHIKARARAGARSTHAIIFKCGFSW